MGLFLLIGVRPIENYIWRAYRRGAPRLNSYKKFMQFFVTYPQTKRHTIEIAQNEMTVKDYNQAIDQHSDGIYRFILKNLRDKDRSRDIVQDTFEKLWVKLSDVNGSKVKSYLFSTAYHTMIDVIRREKRIGDFEEVRQEEYSHSEQYTDLSEILQKGLDLLPEKQKSVIMLRDYEGYSYQEISEITNLTVSQVKVYIYRGRLFLKNYIGDPEKVI